MIEGDYIDQKIIQLRKLYQEQSDFRDITKDEIYLEGKWIPFKQTAIFNETVSLWIPETFLEMPMEVARVKYISSYRPPVILTSKDYEKNLGFHLLKREQADLDIFIGQMAETVLIHAPETVIYDQGTILTEGAEGRWFEYKNFTVTDETYNIQFLLYSAPYLLAGTFNCRMSSYDEWKLLMLKVLHHISIQKKEETTDEDRPN